LEHPVDEHQIGGDSLADEDYIRLAVGGESHVTKKGRRLLGHDLLAGNAAGGESQSQQRKEDFAALRYSHDLFKK
jgi:hypothetical protein